MLIDHIKYNNLINCISYLYNLAQGEKGFRHLATLAHGIPSPKHPGALKSQISEDHEMVKAFGDHLFPGVYDIKIIKNIFSLVSGLLRSRGFNLHF
jgi:hypothetical protein